MVAAAAVASVLTFWLPRGLSFGTTELTQVLGAVVDVVLLVLIESSSFSSGAAPLLSMMTLVGYSVCSSSLPQFEMNDDDNKNNNVPPRANSMVVFIVVLVLVSFLVLLVLLSLSLHDSLLERISAQ